MNVIFKYSPMGTFLFGMFSFVLKFPLNIGGIRENNLENKKIKEAKGDPLLSFYLPKYFCKGPFLLMPYLHPISEEESIAMANEIFSEISFGEPLPLKKMIEVENFIDLLNRFHSHRNEFWIKKMDSIFLPQSSFHGDFHRANLLKLKSKYFFIDWNNYSEASSFYLDLINLYVENQKSGSWCDQVVFMIKNRMNYIYNIKIQQDFIVAYSIWRAAKELKTLKNIKSTVPPKKYLKYKNLLDGLFEEIC